MVEKLRRRLPTPVYRKNRLLSLQRFEPSGTTTRGQPAGNWVTVTEVWAAVQPLTTRTAEAAHQVYAQATHRLFVDYRADLAVTMRLLYGKRVYSIGSMADLDDAHVTVELLCTEGQASGC